MAAPQVNANKRREMVAFPSNTPVTLALAYSEPRMISGPHGERAMFTTFDNRVLFLDPAVAGKIAALGINVRENFSITRKPGGSGQPDMWEVARVAGEQPNGTLVLAANPEAAKPSVPEPLPSAANLALVEAAISLVDGYAAVLEHALRIHGGRVKPDEVRAIFLTAAINGSKTRAG